MLPADPLDEEEGEDDAGELGECRPQQVVVVAHLQGVTLGRTGFSHLGTKHIIVQYQVKPLRLIIIARDFLPSFVASVMFNNIKNL